MVLVNCYLTTKGVFCQFSQFLPLKKVRGKLMSKEILKILRDQGYQAFGPVIYVKDLQPIENKIKGQKIKIELQDLSFIYKSDFKIMKEKLLKEILK